MGELVISKRIPFRTSDNFGGAKFYFLALLFLCMLFNLNAYLDYCLSVFFVMLFLFNINKKYFSFTYFALVFFESKLAIPTLGISVLMLFLVIHILRFLILAISNQNNMFLRVNAYTVIFALLYFIFSLRLTASVKEYLSTVANLLAVIMLLLEINNFDKETKEYSYNLLLAIIAVFALFSGIYGLYNGVVLDFGAFKRYCGTIDDPNYSVMLYSLGIFCGLSTNIFSKKVKIVVILGLCFVSYLTVSMSGLLFLVLGGLIYLAFIKPKYALVTVVVLGVLGGLFLVIPLSNTPFYSFQYRILNILRQVFQGDFSGATSSRTDIWSQYLLEFRQLNVGDMLFGGYNTLSGPYRDYMVNKVGTVSHNSYIDMLFYCGILGITILLITMLYGLIKNLVKYKKSKDMVYLGVAMTKLTILYYSLNLSIFPYRYFLCFMLL